VTCQTVNENAKLGHRGLRRRQGERLSVDPRDLPCTWCRETVLAAVRAQVQELVNSIRLLHTSRDHHKPSAHRVDSRADAWHRIVEP